jgi:thiol-disulfide isomerase/thioredoxin
MRDDARKGVVALSRRSILMAAPVFLVSLRTSRAQQSWPPVFEAGRSQFTIVRPRASMPQLRLQDLNGRDVVVTAKPGRITLVNFWATWCAACRLDLPTLASLAGSRPDRLDIVAICTDTKDLRKIRTFLGGLAAQNLACYAHHVPRRNEWPRRGLHSRRPRLAFAGRSATAAILSRAGLIQLVRMPPPAADDDAFGDDLAVADQVLADDVLIVELAFSDRDQRGVTDTARLEAAEIGTAQRHCGVDRRGCDHIR